MSVADLKAQADRLSFEDLSELARHLRSLVLLKDPQRKTRLRAADQSRDWMSQAEFEKALRELNQAGR